MNDILQIEYLKSELENVIRENYNKLYSYVFRITGNHQDSEDIVITSYSIHYTKLYEMDGDDTIIQLKMKTPIPFNIKYDPCSYYKDKTGDYYLHSFDATSVTVEFDYVSSVSGPPAIPGGSIFSSASWDQTTSGDRVRYQLKLNLAQAGIFAGVTSSYSNDGTLSLRFNGYKRGIAGSVIVIDPGHGVGAKTSGKFDPGAIGQVVEQSINISVARKLRDKLSAMGATVYMLPTDTTEIQTVNRASYARQYRPDMFISIHCNAVAGAPNTGGSESYYFMPFSQPLAYLLNNSVSSYFAIV